MVIPRPLVTIRDFQRFIFFEAPVRSVTITNDHEPYAVTIEVEFKGYVVRRRRALHRLDAILRPELPPGMKLTLRY